MTRRKLLEARESGVPFVIKMADGTRYEVSEPYRMALGQSIAMVVGDDDLAHRVRLSDVAAVSYSRRK